MHGSVWLDFFSSLLPPAPCSQASDGTASSLAHFAQSVNQRDSSQHAMRSAAQIAQHCHRCFFARRLFQDAIAKHYHRAAQERHDMNLKQHSRALCTDDQICARLLVHFQSLLLRSFDHILRWGVLALVQVFRECARNRFESKPCRKRVSGTQGARANPGSSAFRCVAATVRPARSKAC